MFFAVDENGAIVKDTLEGYGLVDRNGKYIIEPKYRNLLPENGLFHGMNIYEEDTALHLPLGYDHFNVHTYFDGQGKFLFEERTHAHGSFATEDLAWFRFGTTYHIRDKKGKLIKEFVVEENRHFIGIADNKLLFSDENETIAYGKDGEVAFSLPFPNYSKIFKLSENLIGLLSSNADYYFLDSLGNPKPYQNTSYAIGLFSSDQRFFKRKQFLARDRAADAVGIIDQDENVVLDFKYELVGALVNGNRLCVEESQKAYFVNESGEIVFDYSQHPGIFPVSER